MVSVSSTSEFLLADASAALRRSVAARPQSDLALIFGQWIGAGRAPAGEIEAIVASAAQRGGAQQDYQTVAVLGYASACGLLDSSFAAVLTQGLERLAGRQPFVDGNPMAFCSDAVAILGVALGARHLAVPTLTSKIVSWLKSFVLTICEMEGTEEWQRCLFHAADQILGGNIAVPPCDSDLAADARVALIDKGILGSSTAPAVEDQERAALQLVISGGLTPVSFERASMRLAAIERVMRSAPVAIPGRMTSADLLHLLERFPAGLRNWTWEIKPRTPASPMRQWHVDHEYHVQNMLWFLLAPIFPDLDDEQYLTKIGQKSPRADLFIPSMKTIVEAKFLRKGDKIQKIIDEISSDASLYGALGNDCDGIIPFIWDDSARSHEHDYLKQGLKKLKGVIGTVIVSRPSNWIDSPSAQDEKQPAKKKSVIGTKQS